MNSRRFSGILEVLFTSLLLLSFVGEPAMVAAKNSPSFKASRWNGPIDAKINTLANDPATPYSLLTEKSGGMFIGTNSGGNWSTVNTGLINPDVYAQTIYPTLLWNTFMGSEGFDQAIDIAVDGSGNVYVLGYSLANWGTPLNPFAGSGEVFVAKLNSSGVLQWNTFLGGVGGDDPSGIAVDGSGNIYVAGGSSATWGAPLNAFAGSHAAFVAKLDGSGALSWNTFLGSDTSSNGIAVDGSGNVYISGNVYGTGLSDVFATMLKDNGETQWSTYLGSSESDDYVNGIAVDGSGNVFVVGRSKNTWGTPVNALAGGTDVFAAELNNSGVLQWNTFMGATDDDFASGIQVDGSGNVYVTGGSDITWGTPVNEYTGGWDAFVAKLDGGGARQWNTFMGSSTIDSPHDIALDESGNVYVTGESDATWGTPQNAYAGGEDAFAVKFNSGGVRQWNTFMGSNSGDVASGIAVDGSGNIYVTGYSVGTWGTPVNPPMDDHDGFVAKLAGDATITYSISGSVADGSGNGISGVSISDGAGHTATTDSGGNYTLIGLSAGTYTITPSKNGFNFTPLARTVTITNANVTGQDFSGVLMDGSKPWLIMYYLAGDNSLHDLTLNVVKELTKRKNQSNYNIAVMEDAKGDNGSNYYYISNTVTKINKGELNSGSPETLVNFVDWARSQAPTQHSALIINDHGTQTGVAWDETSGEDHIELIELNNAFQQIVERGGKIDIVYMQTCLMGTIEGGYELRQFADYYVASEQLMWMGTTLDYLGGILSTTQPEQLAMAMAQEYFDLVSLLDWPFTISVAYLPSAGNLASKVSDLAGLLKTKMNGVAQSLLRTEIISNVQRFQTDGDIFCALNQFDEAIDLYDFSRLIFEKSDDQELINSAYAVMQAVENGPDKYIIYNQKDSGNIPSESRSCLGTAYWNLDNSHGVSIFFTKPESRRSFYYGGLLSFAAGTDWGLGPTALRSTSPNVIEWGPMLVAYLEQVSPGAPDDPVPPAPPTPLLFPSMIYLPLVIR